MEKIKQILNFFKTKSAKISLLVFLSIIVLTGAVILFSSLLESNQETNFYKSDKTPSLHLVSKEIKSISSYGLKKKLFLKFVISNPTKSEILFKLVCKSNYVEPDFVLDFVLTKPNSDTIKILEIDLGGTFTTYECGIIPLEVSSS